jgi:copper(I)-binding protein
MTIYKPHIKNLRVSNGSTLGTPDASSSIQLDDTTTGFLPNRLTTAQIAAIASPATGLMVYNTSTNLINVYTGSSWDALESAGTAPLNILHSVGNALTAVGTNRATSLALTKDINVIGTAAAGTGVTLPTGIVGMVVTVFNEGANAIKVYGAGSDTIDGAAAATGVTLTNAKRASYYCVAAATWISAQLGVASA